MTYIIILHGDNKKLVANADCGVGVLCDWLLCQLSHSLPKSGGSSWQLDLCDSDGGLRLLSALPASCRGLDVLSAGGTYWAVARPRQPGALFHWLGHSEPEKEKDARLVRDQLGWELAALRLGDGAEKELMLPAVLQVLAGARASSASGLARLLAKVAKDARTERLAALEEALNPQKKWQQAARQTSKGRSGASSRASPVKASPQPQSKRTPTPN